MKFAEFKKLFDKASADFRKERSKHSGKPMSFHSIDTNMIDNKFIVVIDESFIPPSSGIPDFLRKKAERFRVVFELEDKIVDFTVKIKEKIQRWGWYEWMRNFLETYENEINIIEQEAKAYFNDMLQHVIIENIKIIDNVVEDIKICAVHGDDKKIKYELLYGTLYFGNIFANTFAIALNGSRMYRQFFREKYWRQRFMM